MRTRLDRLISWLNGASEAARAATFSLALALWALAGRAVHVAGRPFRALAEAYAGWARRRELVSRREAAYQDIRNAYELPKGAGLPSPVAERVVQRLDSYAEAVAEAEAAPAVAALVPHWSEKALWITRDKPASKAAQFIARLVQPVKGTVATTETIRADDVVYLDQIDALDDAFVPAPSRSDVHTVDVTVRGVWVENPNASAVVQEACLLPIVHNQIRTIIEHLVTSRPKIQGGGAFGAKLRRWFEYELEAQTRYERGLDRFVADLARQMLLYGSAALIKQRTMSSEVRPYKDPQTGRVTAPVWGYAVPDMSTMEAFIDKHGRAAKWRQQPHLVNAKTRPYRTRDVFLVRLPTQNASRYFWTPSFVAPALPAVETLRAHLDMIDAHTQALVDIRYYAKVGHKDFQNGLVTENMLDTVATTLDKVSRGGTPVFPFYVELVRLELDEQVSQLEKAKHIWELEVRRGVGGSQLQDGVGDSSTRNTSDALTEKEMRVAQALVPELQRAFRWLTIDKLYEFGLSPDDVADHDDLPQLVFEEIDPHQQQRRETQAVSLWQSDAITHDELRQATGRTPDDERTGQYHSDLDLETHEAQAKVDAQYAPAPTENDSAGKRQAAANKTKSQTAPGGKPRPKRPND